MKCEGCGWPFPPHELARGRCLKCVDKLLVDTVTSLLRFHPESPETGAELPRDCWLPEYADAVDAAMKAIAPPQPQAQPPPQPKA